MDPLRKPNYKWERRYHVTPWEFLHSKEVQEELSLELIGCLAMLLAWKAMTGSLPKTPKGIGKVCCGVSHQKGNYIKRSLQDSYLLGLKSRRHNARKGVPDIYEELVKANIRGMKSEEVPAEPEPVVEEQGEDHAAPHGRDKDGVPIIPFPDGSVASEAKSIPEAVLTPKLEEQVELEALADEEDQLPERGVFLGRVDNEEAVPRAVEQQEFPEYTSYPLRKQVKKKKPRPKPANDIERAQEHWILELARTRLAKPNYTLGYKGSVALAEMVELMAEGDLEDTKRRITEFLEETDPYLRKNATPQMLAVEHNWNRYFKRTLEGDPLVAQEKSADQDAKARVSREFGLPGTWTKQQRGQRKKVVEGYIRSRLPGRSKREDVRAFTTWPRVLAALQADRSVNPQFYTPEPSVPAQASTEAEA